MGFTISRFSARVTLATGIALCTSTPWTGFAQQPSTRRLTLDAALEDARRVSPDLRAAREAVTAAAGRARQARAWPNPALSYGREQTSASGATSSQNVVALEQRLEIGGIRGARADAADLRHAAAAARLAAAEAQLVFETTRAYALALAADRRAALAEAAANAFNRAAAVSERRLAAGDIAGYAHRRLRLEVARYATVRAEALLGRRSARLALASLVSESADSAVDFEFVLADSLPSRASMPSFAPPQGEQTPEHEQLSLTRTALGARADLRALELEAAAARAETRLAGHERWPAPAVTFGFKSERAAGAPEQANGFTAGLSIPLPLWDRRRGAIVATDADARRRMADADLHRRRIVREVVEAYDEFRTLDTQLTALGPELDVAARAAMNAVQVAYAEGEITLVEWLDAVRAYYETESGFATLRAEALIRRAALLRAVGILVSGSTQGERSGATTPARD